jgi:hypothetical protein
MQLPPLNEKVPSAVVTVAFAVPSALTESTTPKLANPTATATNVGLKPISHLLSRILYRMITPE